MTVSPFSTSRRAALVCAALTAFAILPVNVAHTAGADSPTPAQIALRFVSTREKNSAVADASDYLGDGRGPTTYGRCVVVQKDTEPRSRLDGLVEFLLPVNRSSIIAVEELRPAAFWRELESSLAADASRSIVLFVHGYAYGFARGCRRVSDLQRVLGDEADVILFSWPSDGNPLDYEDDLADLEWSVPELAALIRQLADRFGADRIALAAHSMGTVGVLDALERLQADNAAPVSAELVLFAPDYGIPEFLDKQAMLERMVERTTVYVSEKDRLLRLSAQMNGAPRLGQGGEHLVTGPGFDTIDAGSLSRYHPTGHEYHVFHPLVEQDLVELLLDGAAASSRTHTVEATHDGRRYWTLAGRPASATD